MTDLLSVLLALTFSSPFPLQTAFAHSLSRQHPSTFLAATRSLNSESTPEELVNETCQANEALSNQRSSLFNSLTQIALWAGEPHLGMSTLIENLGPQVAAYLNPTPFPDINEKAKLARVPVFMYHDILPEKEVFFDVTPEEFENHLKRIQEQGATPISLEQLVTHLRTGLPLPEKPILLSFDDGYGGHYKYVYPLLKKYGYPAVFSIYTSGVGNNTGRSHVSWEELKEMAADPLITIAAHSLTHPRDLRELPDDQMQKEVKDSKQILEEQLGIPIRYFTYPEGKYDERVAEQVREAGYQAALTMSNNDERFAEESESLLAIGRFGQSRLEDVLPQAWGGFQLSGWNSAKFDFTASIQHIKVTVNETPFLFVYGGQPTTIHAKSRYQVPEILEGTKAIAGVDGGFFSLKYLDSNVMIGPVFSQSTNEFVPGNKSENPKLTGRPLVLISPHAVKFIPFDPTKHNTLSGIQAEMPNLTDAFVAAAVLVKNSQPQPSSAFGKLFDFEASRHRAFWGINQAGQPTIGVSAEPIGSVELGEALAKVGFRDAVMLDSGASTSLAYKGESLVGYTPRPVPHVVGLIPPVSDDDPACVVAKQ
jgi:peptidoglycan/xylan/chitin deacetylase (PgdA/CDA1 family)